MAVGRSILISVALFATLFDIFQDRVTIPSCHFVLPPNVDHHQTVAADFEDNPQDLTAILVSNLLLGGNNSSVFDVFRDFFLSKFFSKSFETLKPDMLLILGDVSANGFQLTSKEWSSVVQHFQKVIGPYLHLPFHVTLGDRDIGECSKLKARLVNHLANSFPELNHGGCGSFEMSNVSFISLNSMALLCGNNELLSAVETVIESESAYIRTNTEDGREQTVELNTANKASYHYRWRDNPMSSQSGPVLLVHFPLQQTSKKYCRKESNSSTIWYTLPDSLKLLLRRHADPGPYELQHAVPQNATEYIFQALKPRIVFSAHSHEFCDFIHPDGTREVTVPALTWKAKDDPGFLVATFRNNGPVIIKSCSLPRESYVVVSCIIIFILSILPVFVINLLRRLNSRHDR